MTSKVALMAVLATNSVYVILGLSVLVFFAVHEHAWLDDLQLAGRQQIISARFAMFMGSMVLAMLVFKWLLPFDARAATPTHGAPSP